MPFPVRACDLICLEHCNKKIFGTELPECCPVCETNLSQCDLKMPPFKLPSPFARAQDHPCSVVIKPTKGDFLVSWPENRGSVIGNGMEFFRRITKAVQIFTLQQLQAKVLSWNMTNMGCTWTGQLSGTGYPKSTC